MTNNISDDFYPRWSPDGKQIAFITTRETEYGVATINLVDGKVNAFRDVSQVNDVSWSPDGSQLVLGSKANGNWEIYTISSTGINLKNITHNSANDLEPRWSPDGTKILFWSSREHNLEVYLTNIEGNYVTNLTLNPDSDAAGIWSPSGLHIAFESGRSESNDLWIMTDLGGDVRKIAADISNFSAAWQPCSIH